MYLIVGLGNPEEKYNKTRHNMGFNTIDKISREYHIELNKKEFEGLYGIGEIYGNKVILLKPQTYMNLSGKSILKLVNFYKIDLKDIIVIYDDMDVDIGKIKIRKKGGAGSHNGMKSVVQELNSEDFSRIRVGIGKPILKELMMSYVLEKLQDEKYKELEEGIDKAYQAAVEFVKNGIDTAMNKFN